MESLGMPVFISHVFEDNAVAAVCLDLHTIPLNFHVLLKSAKLFSSFCKSCDTQPKNATQDSQGNYQLLSGAVHCGTQAPSLDAYYTFELEPTSIWRFLSLLFLNDASFYINEESYSIQALQFNKNTSTMYGMHKGTSSVFWSQDRNKFTTPLRVEVISTLFCTLQETFHSYIYDTFKTQDDTIIFSIDLSDLPTLISMDSNANLVFTPDVLSYLVSLNEMLAIYDQGLEYAMSYVVGAPAPLAVSQTPVHDIGVSFDVSLNTPLLPKHFARASQILESTLGTEPEFRFASILSLYDTENSCYLKAFIEGFASLARYSPTIPDKEYQLEKKQLATLQFNTNILLAMFHTLIAEEVISLSSNTIPLADGHLTISKGVL